MCFVITSASTLATESFFGYFCRINKEVQIISGSLCPVPEHAEAYRMRSENFVMEAVREADSLVPGLHRHMQGLARCAFFSYN